MGVKRDKGRRGLMGLLAVGIILTVLWFFASLQNLDSGQREAGREQLETTLRRAAVACYAAEGIYPPTVDYLTEYYGVQINSDRYIVYYEAFAENLMPNITVLRKGEP